MDTTLRTRRGPRYAPAGPDGLLVSEALRSFRAMTAGATGLLHLPSLPAMRAGVVRSPHTLTIAFLAAGRRAGLPRAWAEQFVAWCQAAIEDLWRDRPACLVDLRRRALHAEAVSNIAEQEDLLQHETLISLRHDEEALRIEIAADLTLHAELKAKIRLLEIDQQAAS